MFNQENILIELTPRFWNQLEFRDGLSLGLGEGGGGEGAQILKKKKNLVCVYTKKIFNLPQNMQSWTPPSKKKNYKLAHEIQKYMFYSVPYAQLPEE